MRSSMLLISMINQDMRSSKLPISRMNPEMRSSMLLILMINRDMRSSMLPISRINQDMRSRMLLILRMNCHMRGSMLLLSKMNPKTRSSRLLLSRMRLPACINNRFSRVCFTFLRCFFACHSFMGKTCIFCKKVVPICLFPAARKLQKFYTPLIRRDLTAFSIDKSMSQESVE